MSDNCIQVEYRGQSAILTLNRPDKKNVFNKDMWHGLELAVARLKANLPRAIVVTGAEGAFSAGFDVNPDNPQIAILAEAVKKRSRTAVEEVVRYIRETVDKLVALPVPIIAAINGLAFGGGAELAVRCDMRVMDPGAVICFSEVRLGLMPDWGGGVALSRLLGRSLAADLILTARRVTADEALGMGLVNRISKPGKSLDESLEIAGVISKNGPLSVRAALEVIRRSPDIPFRDALELETLIASDLIASGECLHGITAFLSKKDPDFPDPK
jgi:enoyl-CoA hydratase/carnithine racemase